MDPVSRVRRNHIVLFISALSIAALVFSIAFMNTAETFAEASESSSLFIDPGSLSGEREKEGNILAEYGISVFTEETMSEMKAAKEREEKARQDIVDDLFSDEWGGTDSYDEYVNDVIKAGRLFEKVNTGVEIVSEEGRPDLSEWIRVISTGALMCLISVIAVALSRKRNANKRKYKTR